MSGLALFLLGGCIAPLMILALAMASAGMELDLHVTLRSPKLATAAMPAPPVAPLGAASSAAFGADDAPLHRATGTALAYAAVDIRLETALSRVIGALDLIIHHAGPQAAHIAANTARRLGCGDTPNRQRLDFARSRLEVLALGTDHIAAAHARAALGIV